MNKLNRMYLVGGILIIGGSIMKILHIPFGGGLTTSVLIIISIIQARFISKLEKQLNTKEDPTE